MHLGRPVSSENILLFTGKMIFWYLNVTLREDANTTLDKQEAQNQNIIRKCNLNI